MSWCWGKGTSVICWRITRPTTTGCARTLRSTRMLRSIDLRRQSGLSHQSLGSAVSIGTTFGWHNRYTQVLPPAIPGSRARGGLGLLVVRHALQDRRPAITGRSISRPCRVVADPRYPGEVGRSEGGLQYRRPDV